MRLLAGKHGPSRRYCDGRRESSGLRVECVAVTASTRGRMSAKLSERYDRPIMSNVGRSDQVRTPRLEEIIACPERTECYSAR